MGRGSGPPHLILLPRRRRGSALTESRVRAILYLPHASRDTRRSHLEGGTLADPVVELVRVSKSFPGTTAVRDVSFTIERGEFFSMLGPSGCGKTTTLRLIAGFEQ